jgi:hypothetical protein
MPVIPRNISMEALKYVQHCSIGYFYGCLVVFRSHHMTFVLDHQLERRNAAQHKRTLDVYTKSSSGFNALARQCWYTERSGTFRKLLQWSGRLE